jgi:hypothetical protein
MMWRLLVAVPLWLLIAALWIPLFLLGIPLTGLMAGLGLYKTDPFLQVARWKYRFMEVWETPDNGCGPWWYVSQQRSHRWGVWMWSAFRNPVGWRRLAVRAPQTETWLYGRGEPLARALLTETFQWHLKVYKWLFGLWLVWPIKKKSPSDHFEFRIGWKFHGDQARFTPWDIGRRVS